METPCDGASVALTGHYRMVGLAGQIGLDIDLSEQWFLNLDVRYIDIEADAKVAGIDVGTVDIDPWLFGLNLGYRF